MTEAATRVSAFKLEYVESIPKELGCGILYVSKRFKTAAHLCPCGCSSKVRTPLTRTAWSLRETRHGPSLHPSIGNWQKPCRSHYFISRGQVLWAEDWTPEEVAAGRRAEEARSLAYHQSLYRPGWLRRFGRWVMSLFG